MAPMWLLTVDISSETDEPFACGSGVLVSCAEGGHDTAHHQPGHDRPSGPWSFETERQPRSSRPHTAEPEQLRGPLSPYQARPGHTGGRYDEDAGLWRD